MENQADHEGTLTSEEEADVPLSAEAEVENVGHEEIDAESAAEDENEELELMSQETEDDKCL